MASVQLQQRRRRSSYSSVVGGPVTAAAAAVQLQQRRRRSSYSSGGGGPVTAAAAVTPEVPKSGLKTPFRDGLLKHVAQEVVNFAKDGLERRGFKETGFLNEVKEVVNTGVTPAEKLLELYHGKWGQSVDPVFEELLY